MQVKYVVQDGSSTVLEAITECFRHPLTTLDAAVAYATYGGVREFSTACGGTASWGAMRKRWLVGIDWCRSHPIALAALASVPNSELRIRDGKYVASQPGCKPRVTFHPKVYMLSGDGRRTVVCGSANLSRNGLKVGYEISNVLVLRPNRSSWDSKWRPLATAFTEAWSAATPWNAIAKTYAEQFKIALKANAAGPTDDEVLPDRKILRHRWVTPERLKLVASAENLWVDVGHLHNRQGQPGTDLQFTAMTRVFFGYPWKSVPGNTSLGKYTLNFEGATSQIRPLFYNRSSSMDRLSLPVPGVGGWPAAYDDETLLFTKRPDGSFDVRVGTPRQKRAWRQASREAGGYFEMSASSVTGRRRTWGVF